MKVSVVGLGKAGLPLAAVIADSGLDVIGLDVDKNKLELLKRKENPIPEEKGLKEIIVKRINKNWSVTNSYEKAISEADAHIVIVPLFIGDDKQPDFAILKNAFINIGKFLKKRDLVVLETTVPVGTTEGLIKNTLEKESGLKCGEDFYLAYSPERIMTGYSISRYKEFPKIVGGFNKESTEKAFELYSKFCNKVEKVTDCKTAELIKIAEGIYRDVNIAIANELLKVCEHYNVNFWELREKANHQFCDIHEPGNVGGHCIPVYPWFLINEINVPLIKTARDLNDKMIEFYLQKVKKISNKGKVGIIGLSYREGVKEKAYSRAIPFIKLLKKEGFEVLGKDPLFSAEEIKKEFDIEEIKDFDDLDVIVIFNKITQYNHLLERFKDKIVDVKNCLK